MQQAQDFLDETRALSAIIAPLSDRDYLQQTAFKAWTIDMVLRHLHFWNKAALMSVMDEAAFSDLVTAMMGNIQSGRLTAFENEYLQGLSGRALLNAWCDSAEETAAGFSTCDPSQRVKWVGPSMSARSSITARLMETWAHGQEVYDHLGLIRKNADRIRNIVVLGVNTYEWTFRNRREEPPGPMPFVELTAPSGDIWKYGTENAEERIQGLAEEFCQVVTQTRNIADTHLSVSGDIATAWMQQAQCFAGPAQEPPVPGLRQTRTVS